MCHVLTVFSFAKSVGYSTLSTMLLINSLPQPGYAYKSIAEFVKHVTTGEKHTLDSQPFPDLQPAVSFTSSESSDDHQPNRSSFLGIPSLFKPRSGSKFKVGENHRNHDVHDGSAVPENSKQELESQPSLLTQSSKAEKKPIVCLLSLSIPYLPKSRTG